MPTMRPPKRGISYSEALAAAYASAPEDEVILDTIELLHPLFLDEEGQPFGVRVVNDHEPFMAVLEDTAPLDPGGYVEFKPCYFQFTRPPESESASVPEVQLRIDNVTRLLIPHLEALKNSRTKITMIWRPYLVSDPSGPHQDPPLKLTLRNIGGDMTSLTARAGFTDLSNLRFPAADYTTKTFPGLVVR